MEAVGDGRSLWRATAPRVPGDDPLPAAADVAVAGAGLVGVATALLLARAGLRVVVFDADSIGARTTGGSTAKLSVLQGTTLSALRRASDDETLRAYAQAQLAGQMWLRDELHGVRGAIEPRTAYTYAVTPAGVDALRDEAEAADVAGLPAGWLDAGDIGLPFPVLCGLRMPDQAQLHPMRVLAHLAGLARDAGVRFVDECRLVRAETSAGDVTVETSRGAITARHLVLATGYPVLDRGLFAAKLIPSRQFVAAYRLPDDARAPDGFYLSADLVRRSVRMATGAAGEPLLMTGGESFTPGRERDTRDRLAALDDWTRAHFPGAERVRWWAAQDYYKADHRPFYGIVPRSADRIFAATGFAKWGMTNGAAAALPMSGQILGDVPDWAEPFGSAAVAWGGLGTAVKANAEVAGEMVRGWVTPHPADGLSRVCTHLGGIVEWNAAECTWDCSLHGSRFTEDGRVLEGPAVRDLEREDAR